MASKKKMPAELLIKENNKKELIKPKMECIQQRGNALSICFGATVDYLIDTLEDNFDELLQFVAHNDANDEFKQQFDEAIQECWDGAGESVKIKRLSEDEFTTHNELILLNEESTRYELWKWGKLLFFVDESVPVFEEYAIVSEYERFVMACWPIHFMGDARSQKELQEATMKAMYMRYMNEKNKRWIIIDKSNYTVQGPFISKEACEEYVDDDNYVIVKLRD